MAVARTETGLIPMEDIRSFVDEIVDKFHPQRVVLFGSYARGEANEHSDVDLLILMPFEGRSLDQSIEIRCAIRSRFPWDLVVRRPEDTDDIENSPDWILWRALTSGVTIYEASE